LFFFSLPTPYHSHIVVKLQNVEPTVGDLDI
jgi:hypothetical protein